MFDSKIVLLQSADEGGKETAKSEPFSSSALPSSRDDLESVAKQLRAQILLNLVNRGIPPTSHPDVIVSVKGHKVVAFFISSFSAFSWSYFYCFIVKYNLCCSALKVPLHIDSFVLPKMHLMYNE